MDKYLKSPSPSFPRRRESISFFIHTPKLFSYYRNHDFSRANPRKLAGLTSRFQTQRRNTYKWWAWPTLLILLFTACTPNKPTINIAVASNFESTLKKIIQLYPDKQVEINIISGSSGVLTNQILNNAPYDLFLSADTSKPQLIYNKLNLKTKPIVYAIGKLALWIPQSTGNNCLKQLPNLKTLALPNPKTAPYGKVAQEILEPNKVKIKKTIQTANALQSYIYTKDNLTQAGFVPYSMLDSKTKGCLQVFEKKGLNQGMVLLTNKANSFFKFIQSNEIKKLITSAGYQ